MLVQDQREFETYERAIFAALITGFILASLGAWGLGTLMARRIMSPVGRLAEEVRHLDASAPPPAPLAQEYADDEIGHLAAAFDDAVARLAKALERERLFTSDVSHDLRTPLMVIASSCELLEIAALAPREHEQVARIARAAGEMRALVETFLVLARARPDSATATATATPVTGERLADTVRAQAERWKEAIRAKGLRFDFLHEAEDDGRYDTVCLNAVMGNLLRNALHYTERGGIRLILERGGFRVEDSGIGIPEAEREKVFEAFARGATAPGEGLGLGLSLVRRVCAHQGWHITLDALPEGGSRFRVRLCRMPDDGIPGR
jgi:signal transduction histidine kinase